MGAPIYPAIKKRARELWEKEGYSPKHIREALEIELQDGILRVPDHITKDDLPQEPSIFYKWAKREGWRAWREAKKEADQRIEKAIAEGDPFPISGIRDPIWHLAVVEVQRYIGTMRAILPKPEKEFAEDVLYHVHATLHPGPRVLERLKPIIRNEIKRALELYQWFDTFDPNHDNGPAPAPPEPSEYE